MRFLELNGTHDQFLGKAKFFKKLFMKLEGLESRTDAEPEHFNNAASVVLSRPLIQIVWALHLKLLSEYKMLKQNYDMSLKMAKTVQLGIFGRTTSVLMNKKLKTQNVGFNMVD